MTDTFDPELDAEYRALIRALHKDTVGTLITVERWWEPDCFRITALGGYASGEDDVRDGKDAAEAIENDWRNRVNPQLLTLIYGHPDPDVRFAADILAKRLWSMVLILNRPRRDDYNDRREDENLVATHLVHDGFERLRRAIYHAPFRIHRPSPVFDGLRVGNTEPLPGRMLQTIKELQESGALPKDSPMPGGSISDAVRRLSDILFMPADERAALFADNGVQDPADEPAANSEAQKVQFGFSFPTD